MKKLFIIPYRDRFSHGQVFINHMSKILEDEEYEFIFVHQCDRRPFNRGAMKNVGFLYAKATYPQEYKDMTLIFHDIDHVPAIKGQFDYETTKGTVKHYFGFNHVLGGMFAIKGGDFERTFGFPNLWGWGFEDNAIQKKWLAVGGKIDRSQWIGRRDKRVVELTHGVMFSMNKQINPRNVDYFYEEIGTHGFHTLKNLTYTVEGVGDKSKMVNVKSFTSETKAKDQIFQRGRPKMKYRPSKITRMSDLLRMGRR
jgi:hypothetical protein